MPVSIAHSADVIPLGRRERTKLANRQAILDAAREVFGEMGYEAASVRDVIRRTQLSVGAFYNYFRSKEELAEALVSDVARRFDPVLRAERERASDLESYLRGALGSWFTFLADEHQNWQARRPPDEPHIYVRQDTPEISAVFDEVRAALTEGMASGQAPPVDVDYLATACIAMARDVGETMLRRRPVDVEGATEFVMRFIVGGLPALPRRPLPNVLPGDAP